MALINGGDSRVKQPEEEIIVEGFEIPEVMCNERIDLLGEERKPVGQGEGAMKKRIFCNVLLALGCSLSFGSQAVLAGALSDTNDSVPLNHDDTVKQGHSDSYKVRFKGGERAIVRAKAHGDDIDLMIYDSHDNLVEKDVAKDDVPVCVWTPKWTGQFTIKVINNENRDVDYTLTSN